MEFAKDAFEKKDEEVQDTSEEVLKGTWFSVGIVGAVILGTNLLLFLIFMTRF